MNSASPSLCARSATSIATLTAWITLALPAVAQREEPAEPPPPDPLIEAEVDAFDDAWTDRKMERDAEAIERLDGLAARLDAPLHPDDRKLLLQVFTKAMTAGRLRPPEAMRGYERLADALSKFGDDGLRVLIRLYERKRFPHQPQWAPMREALVDAVAKTGAKGAIEFLSERVQRSGELGELRAAGAGLGRFANAPGDVRKEMVELLSGRLAGFEAEANAPAVGPGQELNLNRENAERLLKGLADPWRSALTALTGEHFASGAEWNAWYREHRREPWPDREPGADDQGGDAKDGDAKGR